MRLIDGDALYEQAANTAENYCGFFNEMEKVISARDIEKAPTIDAVPVVHGEWIDDKSTIIGDLIERNCSLCGQRMTSCIERLMSYCPNCGAKMCPTSMSGANGGADNG